jgi:XTP/dITP diphosphohydrolase
MGSRVIYLATNNQHKLDELSAMLGPEFDVHLANELGDISWNETGETFAANALIKAQAVKSHTDQWVLADDSGLCVSAIGDVPGVHSSRFAGAGATDQQNNKKLIDMLSKNHSFPSPAKFVCTLALIDATGTPRTYTGECEGQIVEQPRGQSGFGYDPHFEIIESGKTLGEISAEEKNILSHRHQALELLLADLSKFL